MRPNLTITRVEIALSTHFWALPAFRRVEPAMISAPVATSMARSLAAASSEFTVHANPMVSDPAARAAATPPSTYGVRAARADAEHHVVRAWVEELDVGRARARVVLVVLAALGEALEATGEHGDDPAGQAVGGSDLGRVDRGHPASGAGTDVDEPPAHRQLVRDRVDRGGDRGGRITHRSGDS